MSDMMAGFMYVLLISVLSFGSLALVAWHKSVQYDRAKRPWSVDTNMDNKKPVSIRPIGKEEAHRIFNGADVSFKTTGTVTGRVNHDPIPAPSDLDDRFRELHGLDIQHKGSIEVKGKINKE